MNPLVVSVTSVKFKSAFLHASWAVNILRELLRIWSDRKSFNGLNFLQDIYIKFRETELVEISLLPRVWIHGALRMQECRDETEIYNYQRIQVSNNKFINGILGGTLDLAWL